MKKFTFPLLLATALVLGACSTDDDAAIDVVTGDYKIELGGAGNSSAITRAGFTGEGNTRLMVHYVSEKKNSYDDAVTEENPLYMSTVATATKDANNTTESYSEVLDGTTGTSNETAYQRYWDHIHGKCSGLSIYAIAVPNKTELNNSNNKTNFVVNNEGTNVWGKMVNKGTTSAIAHTITWNITPAQTNTTFADEDLTASNNIRKVAEDNDKRLQYVTKSFEKATGEKKLEFKHILSRLTIQVKANTEFSAQHTLSVSSVKLLGFNNNGTYDVQLETYTNMTSTNMDIVNSTTTAASGYTSAYTGLVFPERTLGDSDTDPALTIVANGNSYNVSGKEIADAIKANVDSKGDASFTQLEPGKNYIIQVTVGLKKIEDLQAKLVDWNDVTGTLEELSNARIQLTTMESESGSATTVAYDIYRAARYYTGDDLTNTSAIDAFTDKNFATGYGDKLALAADATQTSWYWPNSTTFYHIRTIAPQSTAVTTSTNDYINIAGGAQTTANDFIWGAPLEETHSGDAPINHATYTYDPTTNGYGSHIYKAIGPTKDKICITQFHMMSNIEVELQSEAEADGGVNLEGSTVYLVRFAANGTMQIGNALITPTTTITTTATAIAQISGATATKANHNYRVIPQAVSRGENAADKIGLVIVTADKNSYLVEDLSTITISGSTTAIDRWLPGKSYKYTFKVMKKKIDPLQAKLVDWTTVIGTIPNDITLEN